MKLFDTLFIVSLIPSINTKIHGSFLSVTHLFPLGETFSTTLQVSTRVTPTPSPHLAYDYVALLSSSACGNICGDIGGHSYNGQGHVRAMMVGPFLHVIIVNNMTLILIVVGRSLAN